MESLLKGRFEVLWKKYFNNAELPMIFYYADEEQNAEKVNSAPGWNCLVCSLSKVRNGASLAFDNTALGCGGAKRYLGFIQQMRPDFKYFLSCGIPDKIDGERYIKSPGMVVELMNNQRKFQAPGKYIVFKRWDNIAECDEPEVVIFFARAEVLSGLFTLANFDQTEPNGTFCPFGAGCGSIVQFPYLEKDSDRPRAVIGMFDPSARPCVPKDTLTFAVPFKKFVSMIENMEESFLITDTWKEVQKRID